MADATRIKDPLEIAAASPDERIRRMAIRRKECAAEMQRIDGALTVIYSFGDAPQAPAVKAPAGAGNGAQPPDGFADAVTAVLSDSGPLSFDALHERYIERVVDDKDRSKDAFRAALYRRKARIAPLSEQDRRYWIVGRPNPAPARDGTHASG